MSKILKCSNLKKILAFLLKLFQELCILNFLKYLIFIQEKKYFQYLVFLIKANVGYVMNIHTQLPA